MTYYEEGTGPRGHKRSWWELRKNLGAWFGPSHRLKCPLVYLCFCLLWGARGQKLSPLGPWRGEGM